MRYLFSETEYRSIFLSLEVIFFKNEIHYLKLSFIDRKRITRQRQND